MRLVQRHSAKKICHCIDVMGDTAKLDEVKRFQDWLLEGLDVPGFACRGLEGTLVVRVREPATVEDCAQLSVPAAERRSYQLP